MAEKNKIKLGFPPEKKITHANIDEFLQVFTTSADFKFLISQCVITGEAQYLNSPLEIRVTPISGNEIEFSARTNSNNGFSELKTTYKK